MIKKLLTRKSEPAEDAEQPSAPAALQGGWQWVTTHKKLSIPLAALVLLAVLAAVPVTRYAVAGLFIKQDFQVVVVDSQTNKPVTSASVFLKGKTAFTDNRGKVKLHVKVGPGQLVVTKTYYKESKQNVTVQIGKSNPVTVTFASTGRPVPVTVTNKLTGKPVKNAVVLADSIKVQTDDKGQATIVLSPDKTEAKGTLSGDGYNQTDITIKVTAGVDPANAFTITPSGKLYFLSNKSGKIDVVKTNLDGTERTTVLAGTGKEDKQNTVLLATTDWKYLALFSRRDGGTNDKLFLIDTSNDQMTTMDEGNASFRLTGWSGHYFVYTVTRTTVQNWQSKQQALKSYNADGKKITTLDETAATGASQSDYVREIFGDVYAQKGLITYPKNWDGGPFTWYSILPAKQAALYTVKPDGTARKTVKSFSLAAGTQSSSVYLGVRPYDANDLYLQFSDGTKDNFYDFEDGQVKELKDFVFQQFYSFYPTYLISPDGANTFWSEPRDGKNTLFVGDADGKSGKEIASLSEYQIYGWYTKDYLLVSKSSSELYVLPASGLSNGQKPYKITDYYKPAISFNGYGGGYGGL